jgi:hypothetical protein
MKAALVEIWEVAKILLVLSFVVTALFVFINWFANAIVWFLS